MAKEKIIILGKGSEVIPLLQKIYDISVLSRQNELLGTLSETTAVLVIIDCDELESKSQGKKPFKLGLAIYKEIKKRCPVIPVIMLSSSATIPEAVEAAKLGVNDFIRKPVEKSKFLSSIHEVLSREESMEIKLDPRLAAVGLLGIGQKIKGFFRSIETALSEKKNILFICEPGIDCSSLVVILHKTSMIKHKLASVNVMPFQKDNAENMFWTMLQGAVADSDLLYFENFSRLDSDHQESILEYIKNRNPKGHIRLMASMPEINISKVLDDWINIPVPSLRDRKEDFTFIAQAYIDIYSKKYGKKITSIDLDALSCLALYSWPGNYRELECVLETAVIACETEAIKLKDIQMGSLMLSEFILSAQAENLMKFRKKAEENITKVIYYKAGSEDLAANILDIPKTKLVENLRK